MKRKTGQEETRTNARAAAIRRILSIAKLIRRQGTPDEADEAIEWERLLEKRLAEVEQTETAVAA